jgi:glycosyltransferase involved in cell wall biosynthesis
MGGAWNYIASLIQLLETFDHENEYVAYCNASSSRLISDRGRMEVRLATRAGANQLTRLAYENSWLQYRAKIDQLELMHWFGNTQAAFSIVPAAITVHDLRSFEGLGEYNPSRMLHARLMIPWSVKRAKVLLPVSQSTARALQERFHPDSDRIFVVHYPLGESWRPASSEKIAALRARYGLPAQFWLYVAHSYPHKNHRTLFAAYVRLAGRAGNIWPLVLRGDDRPGGIRLDELAQEFGIASSIKRLPRLPEEEMPILYSAASALIFPSKYEGLGIPLLEALACGCPAIASNIPTTLELASGNVLTCDPLDVESIAEQMAKFQSDPSTLAEYSRKGIECAAAFSPDSVFRSLRQGYDFAIRECKPAFDST